MSPSNDARRAILDDIRNALGRDQAREVGGQSRDEAYAALTRDYRRHDDADREAILERFEQRLQTLGVMVLHAGDIADVPGIVAQRLTANRVESVIVPRGLPESWRPEDISLSVDDQHAPKTVNEFDGVITGCRVAIAETGSIVLDAGPGQGRRLLTLLPDYHLCVIEAGQITGMVPEAIAQLVARDSARAPVTFISGPSATADIELNRVEGVHGPRRLEVIVVSSE